MSNNENRQMKFCDISTPGGAEVLAISECAAPTPAKGEVLVKVAAAGVNRPDIVQRMGLYPPPPGASPILGLEVSGEVIEMGEGVDNYAIGDKVCALCNGGGYAEYVAVPVSQCLPIPNGLSMVEAASLPETFFTVWSNVMDRGKLREGERFLVHGGSSGIGVTAIQIAKAMGATVYTTAGNDEKCKACLDLGADAAINYKNEDFVEQIQSLTNNQGINLILDMVGGAYIEKNIQIAAMDGRIVNIAYLQGPQQNVNFLPIMLKRLVLTGSTLRPQSAKTKASIAQSLQQRVWPLIESGQIKPVIHSTFDFDKATEAHTLMESSKHIGKIILEVS